MKSKNFKIVASIVIILVIIISICLWDISISPNWRCRYYVSVYSSLDSNYTLIVPVALRIDGEISRVMYEIGVTKGNASFELVDTPYGKGLKIDGNDSVTIGVEKVGKRNFSSIVLEEYKQHRIHNLSMSIWGEDPYGHGVHRGEIWMWGYSPSWHGNLTVAINTENEIGGIYTSFKSYDGYLNCTGWQNATCVFNYFSPI